MESRLSGAMQSIEPGISRLSRARGSGFALTRPGTTWKRSRRNRRLVVLDGLRLAVVVDRDIGKIAVGDQDRMRFLATQHPGFEMHGDRGLAGPDQIGMNRNDVADIHRFAKIYRV